MIVYCVAYDCRHNDDGKCKNEYPTGEKAITIREVDFGYICCEDYEYTENETDSNNGTQMEDNEKLCKDCPHFHIDYKPIKNMDMGRASCKKHGLVTDFIDMRKFKTLRCVEERSAE